MIQPLTIERDTYFRRGGQGRRKELVTGATPTPASRTQGRVPRLARLMALAIRFERLIEAGEVADYAELARLGHVTRARITQIMNLRLLAPDKHPETGSPGTKDKTRPSSAGEPNGASRNSDSSQSGGNSESRPSLGKSGRRFISYVAVHPDEESPDPDGVDQGTRIQLEELAIQRIFAADPGLQRTPTNNPGYDLFESSESGQIIRWVEVKAMTSCLRDRPVGLSHTQFDCAREHGESFWLYVVEFARDDDNARILKIQNPAAKAETFTFDHGWADVAIVD